MTRPQGLRISDQVNRTATAVSATPMMITHHWSLVYVHGPKP